MNNFTIDITDDTLFGNEVAQDEDEEIFDSYKFIKNNTDDFFDHRKKLVILKARKGSGKSALCRILVNDLRNREDKPIVVSRFDSDISPILETESITLWVKEWKKKFVQHISYELGSTIGIALDDDAISIVEEAEKSGYKRKNIITTILDRMKFKNIPFDVNNMPQSVSEGNLNRFLIDKPPVWLFIDEIDQDFKNTPLDIIKISSLFIAAREFSNRLSDVKFRLTVKPNVWTIISSEIAAMSHVKQYLLDIVWTPEEIRKLLSKRVEGYLHRNKKLHKFNLGEFEKEEHKDNFLIGLIFDGKFDLGKGNREPHIILSTLSNYRPRWLIEICKYSSISAKKNRQNHILMSDIKECLIDFGENRIRDLSAEYRPQCDKLELVLNSFYESNSIFNRGHNLIDYIEKKIIKTELVLKITGVNNPAAKDIAWLLYQIGFITARKQFQDGSYEHYHFESRPYFFRGLKLDDDFKWEIHPVFRKYLSISPPKSDKNNKKTKKSMNKKYK